MAGRLDGGGQQARRGTIAPDRRRGARPGAGRHGDLRSRGGDEGVRGLWSPARPCRPGQRARPPRQRRQCIFARIPLRGRHARPCRALQPEQHSELRQLHGSRARPGSYARLRRYRCALLRGCRRDPRRAAEHERSSSVCSRAGPRPGAHRRSVAGTARRGAARRSAGCVHHSDHYCCECRGRDAGPGVGPSSQVACGRSSTKSFPRYEDGSTRACRRCQRSGRRRRFSVCRWHEERYTRA